MKEVNTKVYNEFLKNDFKELKVKKLKKEIKFESVSSLNSIKESIDEYNVYLNAEISYVSDESISNEVSIILK